MTRQTPPGGARIAARDGKRAEPPTEAAYLARLERLMDRCVHARLKGLAPWYACGACGAGWVSAEQVAWNGLDCPTCAAGRLDVMKGGV